VSVGRPTRFGGAARGIGRGLLVGLAVAPVAGLAARHGGGDDAAVREAALMSLGLGALAGATVGAIFPEERWARVER
jgi:hypothetical protein